MGGQTKENYKKSEVHQGRARYSFSKAPNSTKALQSLLELLQDKSHKPLFNKSYRYITKVAEHFTSPKFEEFCFCRTYIFSLKLRLCLSTSIISVAYTAPHMWNCLGNKSPTEARGDVSWFLKANSPGDLTRRVKCNTFYNVLCTEWGPRRC